MVIINPIASGMVFVTQISLNNDFFILHMSTNHFRPTKSYQKGKTIMGTDPIQLLDDFQPIHPDVHTEDKQTP